MLPFQNMTHNPSTTNCERRKRRKISQACDQCRARKSRCDGSKPVCGECAQRPSQKGHCRYSSNQEKDESHNEYVSILLARIEELEAQGRSFSQPHPHTPTTHGELPPPLSQAFGQSDYRVSDEIENLSPVPGVNATGHTISEKISAVDAMGASADVEHVDKDRDDMFYGGSSAVSLIRQAYKTIRIGASSSTTGSLTHTQTNTGVRLRLSSTLNLESFQQFSLPPRPLMDKTLDTYWAKIHHLYPFIHKPTFMLAYERLWAPELPNYGLVSSSIGMLGSEAYGPNSVVFHCALNLMLALATQFMDLPTDERKSLGHLFSEKSRMMCKLDLFDDGSLAVIQTLLIMTQYPQSTPSPSRCWNCIGITCRLAQGLGLHFETPQIQQRLSSLEIEMRRRVWHGCVMLDAVVSMTLARPLMLYNFQRVPLPRPLDDQYATERNGQPAERTSWVHFYVESIKVYEILADVVVKVYGKSNINPILNNKEAGFDAISEIECKLSKIESALPNNLDPKKRLETAPEIRDSPLFRQQTYVLLARLSHLRVLLYLPTFIRYCHNTGAQGSAMGLVSATASAFTELSLSLARSLSLGCVGNSIKLISTVHESSVSSTTGAWWYNLLYIRTASVVVLLAMANATLCESVGWEALNAAWTNCQKVLSYLQNFSHASATCLRELERLSANVSDFRARQRRAGEIPSNQQIEEAADPSDFPDLPTENIFTSNDIHEWSSGLGTTLFDELFRFSSE